MKIDIGLNIIRLWMNKSRQRAQLKELDPLLLNDIGLKPKDVEKEVAKPFWR